MWITLIIAVIALNAQTTTSQQRGFPSMQGGRFPSVLSFPGQSFTAPSSGGVASLWNNPLLMNPALGGRSNFGLNGGFGNGQGFGGFPYNNMWRGPRRNAIYTAIGSDPLDPNSQMRLTITERRQRFYNSDFGDDDDWEEPKSWYVQGTFLGSQLSNKAGTYFMVLTQNGRTNDGCDASSLGNIVRGQTMVDINNPFTQMQPQGMGTGVLPNKLLMGAQGPTVFASTLDGVSRRQLAGAGLAACQYINNGFCSGAIPYCATIAQDNLPAMEVPSDQTSSRTVPFSSLLNLGGQLQGGGLGGGAAGGLFGLAGPGLAFTDSRASRSEDEDNGGLLF